MTIEDYKDLLKAEKNLPKEDSSKLLSILMDDKVRPEDIGETLKLLAGKGETVDEIVGFIEGMKERMLDVSASAGAVDIVGTGGDGSDSFNISTVSALVMAACGVEVAKHGNRAASSKCGSADVLEALGVNINLTAKKARVILKKVGIVFLFAPVFHPAMKKVGPIRKELGIRTIFNYLGPFLNPTGVKRMLLGAANMELSEKFLEIAKKLNFEHLMIVSSNDGMDEISVADKTIAYELNKGEVKKIIIDPQELGFKKYSKEELVGGNPEMNARIVRDILSGKDAGAKRDAVILNSAYGLIVAGKVNTVKEGLKLAQEAVESGKALEVLENLIEETNKDE